MALRCYFPETEAAAVSPTIDTAAGQWDSGHTGSQVRRRLLFSPDSSTLTSTAYTPDGSDHAGDTNTHHRQYVSDSLPAQTIPASTWKCQFQGIQPNANCNQRLTVKIYVVSQDGATVRGILSAISRDGDNEWATALTNRAFSGNISELAIQANDRLVVEVGTGGAPAGGSGVQGHNATIRFGCNASTGDLVEDDSSTLTTRRPWLEFSASIVTNVVQATDAIGVGLGEAGSVQAQVAVQDVDTLAVALGEVGRKASAATWGYVQGAISATEAANPTITVTATQGNLMVVIGAKAAGPTESVADTENNTWYPAAEQMTDDGHGDEMYLWWAIANSSNQTTITFSTGEETASLHYAEYSGPAASPADGDSSAVTTNDNTTDHITSGAWSTTADGDLIVGLSFDASRSHQPDAAGTGETSRPNSSRASGTFLSRWVDKVQAGQGSVECTFTDTTYTDDFTTIAAAFKIGAEAVPPTDKADVEALGVGLVERDVVVVTSQAIRDTDAVGLGVVEVGAIQESALKQDVDRIAVGLLETGSVETGVAIKQDVDRLGAGLLVGVTETAIDSGTLLRIGLAEAVAIAGTLRTADTLGVGFAETVRLLLALQQLADALGIGLSEAASVMMGVLPVQDVDQVGVGVSELAAILGWLSTADSLTTGTIERADTLVMVRQGETVALGLSEAGRIFATLALGLDAVAVGLSGSGQIAAVIGATDSLGVGLAESGLLLIALALQGADTLGLGVVEVSLLVTEGVTELRDAERLGVGLSDSALALLTALVLELDALRLGLIEGYDLQVSGVTEIAGLDVLGVGLRGVVSGLLVLVQPADALGVGVVERTPPLVVTLSANDPLAVGLMEDVRIAATMLATERFGVGLVEGPEAVGQMSFYQLADSLGIGLLEAGQIANAVNSLDRLGIGLGELPRIVGAVLAADSLSLSIGEQSQLLSVQAVSDTLGVSLSAAEAILGTLRDLEGLGIGLSEIGALVTALRDTDTVAAVLREFAHPIAVMVGLSDADILAIRWEEVSAILAATPGAVGRVIVATVVSQVPERTVTPLHVWEVIGPLRWPYTMERA